MRRVISIVALGVVASCAQPQTAYRPVYQNGGCATNQHLTVQQNVQACNASMVAQQQADAAVRQRSYDQATAQRAAQEQAQQASAQQTQSNASPVLLDYETKMTPIIKISALAMEASICGLRSDQWLNTLNTSVAMEVQEEANKSNLSIAERGAADSYATETTKAVIHNTSCQTLLNSPTMDELDRLEYRVTGGYH